MRTWAKRLGILTVVWTIACTSAFAGPAFDTPEKAAADPDFALQGEFVGVLDFLEGEPTKFGVQVIALGEGKFKAAAFISGLPGEGGKWSNSPDNQHVEGLRNGDTVTFIHERYVGKLKGEELQVAESGQHIGTLKKVARQSPTLGAKPPEGAVVLFDGSTAETFENGKLTPDHLLMQGVISKQKFGDHTVHVEFRLPYMPSDRGQARGNSGIYLQGRYEVQMLDSFGLSGEDNECGGIYKVGKPKVNMCFPPLAWQTYDVQFTAARFDADGKKTANARVTVTHNGVVIHENLEIPGPTTAATTSDEHGPGPVYLQDHGNPVRYRNIWILPKD